MGLHGMEMDYMEWDRLHEIGCDNMEWDGIIWNRMALHEIG
jgi:hypothetical protein